MRYSSQQFKTLASCSRSGLHNSESSKGRIDQHILAAGRRSLFRGSVEEILKGQVIIRSRAFAIFSATEFSRAARKDLAGRMWPAGRMLCRPDLDCLTTSSQFLLLPRCIRRQVPKILYTLYTVFHLTLKNAILVLFNKRSGILVLPILG